jgi:hypothetical protein
VHTLSISFAFRPIADWMTDVSGVALLIAGRSPLMSPIAFCLVLTFMPFSRVRFSIN